MKGPCFALAVLAMCFCGKVTPAGEHSAGGTRDPRWFWNSIRSAFPSSSTSASNSPSRVTDRFSSTSLRQAVSVILPLTANEPMLCRTTDDDVFESGVCVRIADCIYYGGTSFGMCGGGVGSCCVFEKQCDENSNFYVTQFTSPRYPSPTTGTGECKLSVSPMHSNVCQYRLDFDEFVIAGPNEKSECVTDFLGVTGGSPLPKLCGDLTGEHVYINVKPASGPIELSMDTATTLIDTRSWNVRITQIPCNSPNKAPAGCMQFYNGTSGTIKSLNFKNVRPLNDTTRQLQSQNYGVCINSKVGYCEVTYSASMDGPYSFTVTGDASGRIENFKPKFGLEDCTTDFVTIPGGEYEDSSGTVMQQERYCGTKFPIKVTTSSQPYRMFVKNDADEEDDVNNSGFALNFRHSLSTSHYPPGIHTRSLWGFMHPS